MLNSGYGGIVPADLFPATRGINVIHEGLSVPAVQKRRPSIEAPVVDFEWYGCGASLQSERLGGPGATAGQEDRRRHIRKRIDRLDIHV